MNAGDFAAENFAASMFQAAPLSQAAPLHLAASFYTRSFKASLIKRSRVDLLPKSKFRNKLSRHIKRGDAENDDENHPSDVGGRYDARPHFVVRFHRRYCL